MKYTLLLLLILSYGCCHKAEWNHTYEQNSVSNLYDNDGLQIQIDNIRPSSLISRYRNITIKQDGKLVLQIFQSPMMTGMLFFAGSKAERLVSYDMWGQKAAECVFKDGKPSGTVWSCCTGVNGLKWSELITYKDGERISVAPYYESGVSDWLESGGAEWNMLRRIDAAGNSASVVE